MNSQSMDQKTCSLQAAAAPQMAELSVGDSANVSGGLFLLYSVGLGLLIDHYLIKPMWNN